MIKNPFTREALHRRLGEVDMKSPKSPMSKREQRIWDAVFSAEVIRLVGYLPEEAVRCATERADTTLDALRTESVNRPHPKGS